MNVPSASLFTASMMVLATNALALVHKEASILDSEQSAALPSDVEERIEAAFRNKNVRGAVNEALMQVMPSFQLAYAYGQQDYTNFAASGGVCYVNCYSNCHSACHSSRSMR